MLKEISLFQFQKISTSSMRVRVFVSAQGAGWHKCNYICFFCVSVFLFERYLIDCLCILYLGQSRQFKLKKIHRIHCVYTEDLAANKQLYSFKRHSNVFLVLTWSLIPLSTQLKCRPICRRNCCIEHL